MNTSISALRKRLTAACAALWVAPQSDANVVEAEPVEVPRVKPEVTAFERNGTDYRFNDEDQLQQLLTYADDGRHSLQVVFNESGNVRTYDGLLNSFSSLAGYTLNRHDSQSRLAIADSRRVVAASIKSIRLL